MHALGAALALALASSIAAAQGPANGAGPGMMGGYGAGGGMMGGYGSGMMGGYGPGYGMMGGYGGPAGLNLSQEQQDKLFALREEHRSKNWDTMGKMRAEMFKLRRMYYSDNVDSKAVLDQQKRVDELRREMLASRLEMHKQMEGVLTPEQRKQARQFGPWWAGDDE